MTDEKAPTPAPMPARVFDIGDKLSAILLWLSSLGFIAYLIETLT